MKRDVLEQRILAEGRLKLKAAREDSLDECKFKGVNGYYYYLGRQEALEDVRLWLDKDLTPTGI